MHTHTPQRPQRPKQTKANKREEEHPRDDLTFTDTHTHTPNPPPMETFINTLQQRIQYSHSDTHPHNESERERDSHDGKDRLQQPRQIIPLNKARPKPQHHRNILQYKGWRKEEKSSIKWNWGKLKIFSQELFQWNSGVGPGGWRGHRIQCPPDLAQFSVRQI